MSYKISNSKFNEILERLSNDYEIYAPVRIKGRGRFSDTDNIRYQKISKVEEIEYKEKSRFSAKEIPFPATETIFNIVGFFRFLTVLSIMASAVFFIAISAVS